MIDIRELERAVISAAMDEHRGCAPETCGGSRLDPCRLGSVIDRLLSAFPAWPQDGPPYEETGAPVEIPDVWVLRTFEDVRSGDAVRLPGRPDTEMNVFSVVPQDRHVDPRSSEYRPEPLEHRIIAVRFGDEHAELREMNPAAPVEILFSSAALLIVETMGWESR